jgi:hypothetical protein
MPDVHFVLTPMSGYEITSITDTEDDTMNKKLAQALSRDTRDRAQDQLMLALQTAFTAAAEQGEPPHVLARMEREFGRVEKLFGYEPGSWHRGT